MASLNVCFFIGNLTRDPELKYTPKGTAVTDIGLAVNRQWTNDSGEKQEEVTFLNLAAWGKTAELAGEYLKKGSLAHFQCRAKLDQWDDKQTGQKRSAIRFVVEQMTFLPSGGGKGHQPSDEEAPPQARKQQPPPPKRPAPKPKDPDLDAEEDDIPFRSILVLASKALNWLSRASAKAMLQMRGYKTPGRILQASPDGGWAFR